jgi:hypothetical protein
MKMLFVDDVCNVPGKRRSLQEQDLGHAEVILN